MLHNVNLTLTLSMIVDAADGAHADAAARIRAATAAPTATVAAVVTHPLSVVEQLQADNLTSAQELMALDAAGTASQKARWLRGVLPDEELLEIARAELFAPFGGFARRRKISHTEIQHTTICAQSGTAVVVDWSIYTEPLLNAEQWRNLELAEARGREVMAHPWMALAPRDACHVAAQEHRGVCSQCHRSVSQMAVRVTIAWAGRREMSREYMI